MINNQFNTIKLAGNINNITIIDKACTISTNNILSMYKKDISISNEKDYKLAFLPYCNYKEVLELPEGDFLFSHQDIQGSIIRGDFKLPEGLDPNILKSKYKLVFNGHIHKSSIYDNIINVGSISTHSFSDDENTIPQCYIFDTNTFDLKSFKLNICPLFRRVEIENIEDLETKIKSLDKTYKYILHIISPYEIKEEIKNFLNKEKDFIIANRITTKVKQEKIEDKDNITIENLQSNIDIKHSFKDFIEIIDLKYPKDIYKDIINELNI